MADISKIKAINGTTYDIKDKKAIHNGTALMTTNPFAGAGHSASDLYIPKIDNALYCAGKRFNVTVSGEYSFFNGVDSLFNGVYDANNLRIADDKQVTITIDFSSQPSSRMPGYPYGYIFMSFYAINNVPKEISARVYNNYSEQTVGWKTITFEKAFGQVYVANQDYYGLQTIEITLTGDGNTPYGYTALAQIDMWLTRPNPNQSPFLFKGAAQELYYDLTAPNFKGNLTGNVTGNVSGKVNNHNVDSDVPANAVFTDTTYSEATTSTAGLMSAADKTKLNGIDGSAYALKADTVLDTTLSRGRASGTTVGTASFAFGNSVTASGIGAHAEGSGTRATDSDAHAEGSGSAATASAAHAEGAGSTASGQMSHAEGAGSTASGTISHAEGSSTLASGVNSHAEGSLTLATGGNSHSEGYYTAAAGHNSHAEGMNTAASGVSAHVEGAATGNSNAYNHIKVTGDANATTYTFTYPYSPYIEVKAGDYLKIVKNGTTFVSVTSVSGSSVTVSATLSSSKLTNYTVYVYKTRASGYAAHAEGAATIASGAFSHAEGQGTIASEANCHAEGQYNIAPVSGCIHIVGNGTADNARSNAHTLDMQGNAWYAGDVSVGTNNDYLLREKNLADRYDATSTYAVGDYCIYGGQLYKCTTAISTAEAWDGTHWTATDILSEGGGGGSEISMDVSGDTLSLDFDSDFHRVTTTTLQNDYSPNGSSWTNTVSNVGFENGGYIEAKIDLSTVAGTRENILSIGGEIDSWTTASNTVGHYHIYYTPGDNFVNCTANNNNSVHGPATVTPNSVVTIRVDKDGLWVDGVKIVPKYTSRQYTSVYNTYLALNKAVLSYVTSEPSISVGSAEGSNRSHATYDYIKVVSVKASQVNAITVNDVTLDVSTKAEQSDIDALTSKVNYTRTSLAIHAVGNTHDAIAEGQFVYVRDHSALSTALYIATEAIPANGTLNSSKLRLSGGALNILLGKLTTKDVSSSITVSSTNGTISSMTAYRTGNQVSLAFILTLTTAVDNASLGCTALFSDSSLMPTNRQAGGSNDANVIGVNIDPTTGGANLNARTNTSKASGSAMWLLYSYICTG